MREARSGLGAGALRALLVEDVPGEARLVREHLRQQDFAHIDLEQAETLAEALAALESSRFDIVLLDLGLPDSTGIDTLTRVRRAFSEVPIVVLTGLRDPDLAAVALAGMAEDVLFKDDATPPSVAQSIRHAITQHRREAALRALIGRSAEDGANLRALVENDRDGLLVVDGAARVLFANPAAERLLEVGGGATVPSLERGLLETRTTFDLERHDGRWLELTVSSVVWQGQPAHLVS